MKVRVVVLEEDDIDELPKNAKDMVVWWQDKLLQVPEEYQGVAEWEIEPEETYGAPKFTATLLYTREESEEERNYRVEANAREAASIMQRDLAEFNRLKAKLGE